MQVKVDQINDNYALLIECTHQVNIVCKSLSTLLVTKISRGAIVLRKLLLAISRSLLAAVMITISLIVITDFFS